MLRPNNPEIDFDNLNQRIATQLANYQASQTYSPAPDFDPSPLGSANAPETQAPAPAAAQDQPEPQTLDQLLQLEDKRFIEHAYLMILGRPADPEGRSSAIR